MFIGPKFASNEIMNDQLEKIKEFAAKAHEGQWRKFADEPYIKHPVRVMNICQRYSQKMSIPAAALLHDVLEDTTVTQAELNQFLHSVMDNLTASETMKLVGDMTDIYTKQQYLQWNRRKRKAMEVERMQKTSPDAQTIKYADIIDDCLDLNNAEPDFARLFLFECRALLKAMIDGNNELRQIAIKTVDECIRNGRRRRERVVI
ncbi:HD domain-containing protein [Terrimonas pollutisoli]|uniref:HD domain-containing protein n=1 Tax=Terrimonas pollutisoli TaxID=3034147 RepID=UPI0023EDF49F|nr:HD domain-containing protein [Terrimonas sp. H1YJ31]